MPYTFWAEEKGHFCEEWKPSSENDPCFYEAFQYTDASEIQVSIPLILLIQCTNFTRKVGGSNPAVLWINFVSACLNSHSEV